MDDEGVVAASYDSHAAVDSDGTSDYSAVVDFGDAFDYSAEETWSGHPVEVVVGCVAFALKIRIGHY